MSRLCAVDGAKKKGQDKPGPPKDSPSVFIWPASNPASRRNPAKWSSASPVCNCRSVRCCRH